MPHLLRVLRAVALPVLVAVAAACSLSEEPTSPETLRRQADQVRPMHFTAEPVNACPQVAQVLSWCARGPNFHYRCALASDNANATLTGTLEAVVRADTILVIDFHRAANGNGSSATLYQSEGMLIPDYAPLIESNLNNPDCRRGGRGGLFG